MKKLKMARSVTLTFEEGCNKYLENCRQRNLREGTIGHYRQSYTQFYKYLAPMGCDTHFWGECLTNLLLCGKINR